MSNKLVSYSRAGDAFHYRWAARRCLGLVNPTTTLNHFVIEGSSEKKKAGEYVIDVSEYHLDSNDNKIINYYQLKHTTVCVNSPFNLSDLKDTIIGFANRYVQHVNEKEIKNQISFTIVTNRKIATSFKKNILGIVNKLVVEPKFKTTIEKYTKLKDNELASFCSVINFEDGEGNYNVQKQELRIELSQIVAGSIDNAQVEKLIALVGERILPDSDGRIDREDVLKCLDVTSEKELFPAPYIGEKCDNIVEREIYDNLKEKIYTSKESVIVHAGGGVGKSVFCRHFVKSIEEGSLGVTYDCFGAGSYRNRSESRHRYRDALVQIINELASKGLCDTLIVQNTTLDEDILRKFLQRIKSVVSLLKRVKNDAQLFILIDAADNAEMAALEYSQPCFAHDLLRENLPNGCKLIFLCRTERVYLLKPKSHIVQLELEPFTEKESLQNLRKWYPNAKEEEGVEFHRLTSQNPRVQSNALLQRQDSINEMLLSLGPIAMSVDKQIELQLELAISRIKDQYTIDYHQQVDLICKGLGSLPPLIPIDILSKVANLSIEEIKSFISDFGSSLWLSDTSIQFRDEPTETWFRKTFLASEEDYDQYIRELEPYAHQLPYIAEVLPQLYLLAKQYDKLTKIAHSNDFLPTQNPIDARSIRMNRLQFAFKAALKRRNYKDAVKISMRAGEEAAGNQRQLDLFGANSDLLSLLLCKEKVQEIAMKRLLSSHWEGSENVYAASLLSGINDYHGEARGYLRAANNWLDIYIEEHKKGKVRYSNDIPDDDLLELAYANLNLYGVKGCFEFLSRLKPTITSFILVGNLTKRLIDVNRLDEIDQLSNLLLKNPYFLIAIVYEQFKVGKFPLDLDLETALDILSSDKVLSRKTENSYNDTFPLAVISFLEVCVSLNLPSNKILNFLNAYIPIRATQMVCSDYRSIDREVFIRVLALKGLLSGKRNIEISTIAPKELVGKKLDYETENKLREFKQIIDSLFPWYLFRAEILINNSSHVLENALLVDLTTQKVLLSRYRSHDTLPQEVASVCASILIVSKMVDKLELVKFYQELLKGRKFFSLQDKFYLLRAAYRCPHLKEIRLDLECLIRERIKYSKDETSEEIAQQYIALSRAVLVNDRNDAIVYFEEAVKIVSRFGDEIVQRWNAIVALSRKASERKKTSDELAYRFIRCAEVVGENVLREKYWNRSEAMAMCARMSPNIALSTLSRWRDRDIGQFDYQLRDVLIELIRNKKIHANAGWALTNFLSSHQLNDVLLVCLESETSRTVQEEIYEAAISILQMEGADKECWNELKGIAERFDFKKDTFTKPYAINTTTNGFQIKFDSEIDRNEKVQVWDAIFSDVDITCIDGIIELINRFKISIGEDSISFNIISLLKEALSRVADGRLWDFINAIFLSDDVSVYDSREILKSIPISFKSKVSFENKFINIVYRFGECYAHNLASDYVFETIIKELDLNKTQRDRLIEGIISGLSTGDEFVDANLFFGFVQIASRCINDQDATELVDYALTRFELHIQGEFGEGNWSESIYVHENIDICIAGFIWSALGSPRSEERWRAVHCVKMLADFRCIEIVDSLTYWVRHDRVDAFGHRKFSFYNLHARQYLMIAFARVSIEKPGILLEYSQFFIDSFFIQPHAVIQKSIADIVRNIENAFPETYTKSVLEEVFQIVKTNRPIQNKGFQYITDSPWHSGKMIDTDLDYSFGWDIEKYWFEPLGRIFGISSKQVQELASHLIVNEWELGDKRGFKKDTRNSLWNLSSKERETWHDHGSYPITDDYDFYLAYHSMHVVAARLLKTMPLVKTREWSDSDPWLEWLSGHLLTCNDGKWLSDFRDFLPLNRPRWVEEYRRENWESDISEEYLLSCLQTDKKGESWISVTGGWSEKDEDRIESLTISTAFLSSKKSSNLLKKIKNGESFKGLDLPYFEDEIQTNETFGLVFKGWICERYVSKGIDQFDPYANRIDYPPFSIGNKIASELGVTVDMDLKTWKHSQTNETVMTNRVWSSLKKGRDEEPEQLGMRLEVKLSFLKKICVIFNSDIVFDIGIKREFYRHFGSKRKEYTPPLHKVLILSRDGKIRGASISDMLE